MKRGVFKLPSSDSATKDKSKNTKVDPKRECQEGYTSTQILGHNNCLI